MYFPKLRSATVKPVHGKRLSASEEAAVMSKLWRQHVKERVKEKISENSEVKVRISRGSKYRSSFVGLPASEMASFVSEIWGSSKSCSPKKSDHQSKNTKIEMLNIIGIDGSTKQVPLYKRKMKVLYNNAINSDKWASNPIEAYIIDLHFDKTTTGEPLYTILLSDGRETMTDSTRIKLA